MSSIAPLIWQDLPLRDPRRRRPYLPQILNLLAKCSCCIEGTSLQLLLLRLLAPPLVAPIRLLLPSCWNPGSAVVCQPEPGMREGCLAAREDSESARSIESC